MNKQELWPKEGKMKKALIILAIVVVSTLLIVLLEEKINMKLSKRMPFIIALICVAVWFFKPAKKENV